MFKYEQESYYRFYYLVISKKKRKTQRDLWIADNLSTYSASVIEGEQYYFGKIPNSAIKCVAYLLAIYIDLPEEFDYIRANILHELNKKAWSHNYEGRWQIFQEINDLQEDESFSFYEVFEQVLLKRFSEDDLFGNIAPLVIHYINVFSKKSNSLYYFQKKVQSTKVRRPQFKRGYDDKGHCVLYNQKGSNTHLRGINDNRTLDRRPKPQIKYPSTKPTNYMWIMGAE